MKRVPVRYLLFFSPGALELLGNEIVPNTPPAAASAQYRKSLAISLFYKVDTSIFVQICPSYVLKSSAYDMIVYQFFCSSPLPTHTHLPPHTPSHDVLISLCVHVHACSSIWLPYMGMSLLVCSLLLCPL